MSLRRRRDDSERGGRDNRKRARIEAFLFEGSDSESSSESGTSRNSSSSLLARFLGSDSESSSESEISRNSSSLLARDGSRDRKSKESGSESKKRSWSPRDSEGDKSKSDQSKRGDSNNDHESTTSGVASQSVPNGSNSDAQSAVTATQSQAVPVVQPSALSPPSASTEIPQSTNFETVAAFEADATKPLNPTPVDVDSDAIHSRDDTDSSSKSADVDSDATQSRDDTDSSSESTSRDSRSIHAQLLHSRDSPSSTTTITSSSSSFESDSEDDIDRRDIERRRNVDYEQFANHQVTVKGDNVPPAIEQFSECLSSSEANKPLLDNLEREQFSKPTPIQKHCLPLLLSNRDVMAMAQTGSGKRACAQPLALIMAPTRELTIQIDEQVYKLTRGSWIRSFAVFGGANFEDQSREIEKFQVDILCATPGRLIDMLDACKVSLDFIRHLAIDEADNMLSLGFTAQIRSIEQRMPNKDNRQTMLFSATIPQQIQNLADDFMKESVFIKLGDPDSEPALITQVVKWVEDRQKQKTLLKDIDGVTGKIIVFCGQRKCVNRIGFRLKKLGHEAGRLHGNMEQDKREEVMFKFKYNQYRILVATSVAARGIDIPAIERVINYDMPRTIQDYTHRIGRTGRIGSSGVAISYFNDSSHKIAGALTDFLRANNQGVPRWLADMPSHGRKSKHFRRRKEVYCPIRSYPIRSKGKERKAKNKGWIKMKQQKKKAKKGGVKKSVKV